MEPQDTPRPVELQAPQERRSWFRRGCPGGRNARPRPQSRLGHQGPGAFVRLLRLMEALSQQEVHLAVKDALRLVAVGLTNALALVNELLEARNQRRLLNLQRQLALSQVRFVRDTTAGVCVGHQGCRIAS